MAGPVNGAKWLAERAIVMYRADGYMILAAQTTHGSGRYAYLCGACGRRGRWVRNPNWVGDKVAAHVCASRETV